MGLDGTQKGRFGYRLVPFWPLTPYFVSENFFGMEAGLFRVLGGPIPLRVSIYIFSLRVLLFFPGFYYLAGHREFDRGPKFREDVNFNSFQTKLTSKKSRVFFFCPNQRKKYVG